MQMYAWVICRLGTSPKLISSYKIRLD